MSEAHSSMLKPVTNTAPDLATALLTHYSFDLSGYSASELIRRWKSHYPLEWIHIAVIEALYQGRYKAVSVQQILNFWHRRGQATYHFNMEFERLICSKFPESLTSLPTPVLYPAKKITTVEKTNYHLASSSVNTEPTPHKVERDYSQRPLPPLKVVREAEKQLPSQQTEEVVTSAIQSTAIADTTPVDSELQPSLKPESHLQTNSPVSPASNRPQRLLPVGVNHRAIGQFTPEKSDRTESFASKLKAMSGA